MTATSAARVPAAALLEVVRHRTHAIAEEMRSDLMRSARSTVIREAGDLSCAITDATGGTVAQGNDIPMHLGVLGFTVRELLTRVSPDHLAPGTVFFVNLPAVGGNHLPDVKAIRPVFADGALVAFAVALAHWPDVGGALPGSYVPDAVEIYQEGLQIPPTRLFDADGERDEPLALVLANLRDPERRRGDIRAQAATTGIAERRIADLVQRLGRAAVIGAWEAMQAASERRLRHALAELPDGVWTGQDALDDDGVGGDQVPIRCTLTIRGDQAEFDYSQSSAQTAGPVNTTRFITAASTLYAVKATLAPAAEVNAGLARPLVIRTARGTVCDAGETASLVAGNHETSQRIADAAFQALAQVVPDRVPAAGMGSSGLALFSGQRGGSTFVLYETHAGGSGALPDRDGDSATRIHMSNVMNTPAEVIEAEYPLRVLTAQLRARSGGYGRHRGGDGLRRRYAVLEAGVRLTTMVERCTVAPPGLDGGEAGSPSAVWLVRGGRRQRLPGKGSLLLERDDIIEVETAGGGGHGEPDDHEELTP